MSVTIDILRTWTRGPRAVMRAKLRQGADESRSLGYLMVGCLLVFVAQWPGLARKAYLEGEEMDRLVAYALLAWLVIWPLAFYGLAWLAQGVSRLLGSRAPGADVRLAMFWSWLAAAPVALLGGLSAGLAGDTAATNLTGIAWIGVFAVFWALSQAEVRQAGEARDA